MTKYTNTATNGSLVTSNFFGDARLWPFPRTEFLVPSRFINTGISGIFTVVTASHPADEIINELPGDNHFQLVLPIPVRLEQHDDCWVAWFDEAEIGMSGETKEESVELLSYDIRDAFILFSEQQNRLGPGPASQFNVLRKYIGLPAPYRIGVSSE